MLGFPVTMVTDMDAIAACYKNTEVFRSGGAFPPPLPALFGEKALFTLDGKQHAEKRKPVMPAFTPQLFPLYFSSIQDDAEAFWKGVSEQVESDGKMNLNAPVKDHYLGIILRLTTGGVYSPSSTSAEDQFSRMRDLLLDTVDGLFTLPFGPTWWKALKARDELLDALAELVRDRLATRATTIDALRADGADRIASTARADLRAGSLDLLTVLVASTPLPTGADVELDPQVVQELCELVMLLWFAGYSTQAASTLCCIMEMGFNDDIYSRLRAEQDAITDAHNGNSELTLDQVNKEMPLMDSFITEVLRLYPPAPVLFRKTSATTTVCGHEIEEGTVVGLDTWGGQRNAAYYADPDTLRIDRFLVDEKDGKMVAPQPASILSFGAAGGAHFCLGAGLARVGMKATLSVLVRGFEVRLDGGQSRRYVSLPDMRPKSGVDVVGCRKRERVRETDSVAAGSEK